MTTPRYLTDGEQVPDATVWVEVEIVEVWACSGYEEATRIRDAMKGRKKEKAVVVTRKLRGDRRRGKVVRVMKD